MPDTGDQHAAVECIQPDRAPQPTCPREYERERGNPWRPFQREGSYGSGQNDGEQQELRRTLEVRARETEAQGACEQMGARAE
jgi:hypothetical protein